MTVDVEFHPDVQVTDDLVKEVAAKAHLDEETLNPEAHKIRMSVEYRYLNDLAVLDAVKSIHEVHPVRLLNNVARNILRAHEAINPINGTQYEGEGQVVCVSDTGFDKGSLDPKDVHLAFITNGVVRVKHLYALGRKPIRKANGTVIPGKASDPSGHGSQ